MLRGLGQAGTAVPSTITNAASFYTTAAAGNTQTAIAAGFTPMQWNLMTPAQQSAALAQASGSPVSGGATSSGGSTAGSIGNILGDLFGGVSAGISQGGLTPAQIQQAVSAGYTPTQWAALTPAQRTQVRTGTVNASLTPWLMIGGVVLALMMMKKK